MQEYIVGISGINATDNPGPGVGVARALHDDKELRVRTIGLAYDVMEPGIYLDWLFEKTFLLPYPSSDKDAFIERLAYIKQSYGLDFIIPNLDAELPIYTTYHTEIENLGIKLFLPNQEQLQLRNKDRLPDVAQRLGIHIPQTRIVSSPQNVEAVIQAMGTPLMVKGALYKAHRAYNLQEAVRYVHKIAAEWGYPILFQKIVSGEEMNVIGVGDGEGGLIGRMGIKKMWTTELGKIWTGVTVKHEAMLAAAEAFVVTYQWKGPFELECIVDGDTVYLIEINPRFPAWSYFAAALNLNLPANTLRQAFGLPLIGSNDYDAGKLYVRYTYETITDMKAFQQLTLHGEN